MISIVRSRIVTVAALSAAALALVTGLGTQAAGASTSQVCGNAGAGYCLNDWGGAGASGDAVKMYNGGTMNDDFYVQEVNRCSGHDTVQSRTAPFHDSTDCPFADTFLDARYHGDDIVQITYTNNVTQCAGTNSNGRAVLASCANPISGGGGGNGVIMVMYSTSCASFSGPVFLNRYWSDAESQETYLASGGNVGVQALYETPILGSPPSTCWGGFQFFGP
jgi:hypothetical protein